MGLLRAAGRGRGPRGQAQPSTPRGLCVLGGAHLPGKGAPERRAPCPLSPAMQPPRWPGPAAQAPGHPNQFWACSLLARTVCGTGRRFPSSLALGPLFQELLIHPPPRLVTAHVACRPPEVRTPGQSGEGRLLPAALGPPRGVGEAGGWLACAQGTPRPPGCGWEPSCHLGSFVSPDEPAFIFVLRLRQVMCDTLARGQCSRLCGRGDPRSPAAPAGRVRSRSSAEVGKAWTPWAAVPVLPAAASRGDVAS